MLYRLTKNSIGFAITATLLSVFFFYHLYKALSLSQFSHIAWLAPLYGLGVFVSGFAWGYYDEVRKTRTDIGFLYHLLTYIVVNLTNIVVCTAFSVIDKTYFIGLGLQLILWGAGLYLHYRISKQRIKGLNKTNLFE